MDWESVNRRAQQLLTELLGEKDDPAAVAKTVRRIVATVAAAHAGRHVGLHPEDVIRVHVPMPSDPPRRVFWLLLGGLDVPPVHAQAVTSRLGGIHGAALHASAVYADLRRGDLPQVAKRLNHDRGSPFVDLSHWDEIFGPVRPEVFVPGYALLRPQEA